MFLAPCFLECAADRDEPSLRTHPRPPQADVPALLSNLSDLRTIEMPCPLLPTPDIAPTFQQYLHEAPLSRARPDPWLEAAALSLFKTHLPTMMPAVRAFAERTAVEELVLVSEHTEWRWRLGADDVELRMCFRPVMGGEVFGGGFTAPKDDAWSLGSVPLCALVPSLFSHPRAG